MIHFLYFREGADARDAAELAKGAGWDAAVEEPSEATEEWTVRVDGTRVVSAATIASFRAWFEHLAEDHNGEYDGWEAAAKP